MTRTEQIFNRIYNDNMSTSDIESTKQFIDQLIGFEWTDDEIVKMCKCTEEVSPELCENTALARMKVIGEGVRSRLGKSPYGGRECSKI